MEMVKCDECGEMVEVVEGGEEVCFGCGHWMGNWGDELIPIHGEVSPGECVDYPTHPAQMAEDEAAASDYCECGHILAMHYGGKCHGWKDDGFCDCVVAEDEAATKEAAMWAEARKASRQEDRDEAREAWARWLAAYAERKTLEKARIADNKRNGIWGITARQDAARARRTAAETFEADNGRAEWQPSAAARELVRKCTR